jgi:hypothetical protein
MIPFFRFYVRFEEVIDVRWLKLVDIGFVTLSRQSDLVPNENVIDIIHRGDRSFSVVLRPLAIERPSDNDLATVRSQVSGYSDLTDLTHEEALLPCGQIGGGGLRYLVRFRWL